MFLINLLLIFGGLFACVSTNLERWQHKHFEKLHRPQVSDWPSAYTFFKFVPAEDKNLASARVRYCRNWKTLVVGDECGPRPLTLYDAVQLVTQDKTILFQLDYDACDKVDQETVTLLTAIKKEKTFLLGVRIVQGPNSNLLTQFETECVIPALKDNTIIMFDEHPHSNTGYTETMFRDIVSVYNSTGAESVCFDSVSLLASNVKDMLRYVVPARVSFYDMEGHYLSQIGMYIFSGYVSTVQNKSTVSYQVLDQNHRIRRASSNVYFDWWQRPADTQGEFINPAAFYEYLEQQKPYIQLDVHTTQTRRLTVNEKKADNLLVHLEHVLQIIDKGRTVLLSFLDENYARAPIDQFVNSHHAFVLVRLVRGPNYSPGKHRLQDIQKLVPFKRAIYVVGFAEDVGPESGYTAKQIKELMAVMQSETFKGQPLGVHLAAEHFGHAYGGWEFYWLAKQANFKYLFLNVIQANWTWTLGFHDRNIKYNGQRVSKETYLRTDWDLRKRLYKSERLPWQPPPSTTSTTTTTTETTPGSTPTESVETTTESSTEPPTTTPKPTPDFPMSPEPLTSPPTPSTTEFSVVFSRVSFPTVKNGATTAIGHVWGCVCIGWMVIILVN